MSSFSNTSLLDLISIFTYQAYMETFSGCVKKYTLWKFADFFQKKNYLKLFTQNCAQ